MNAYKTLQNAARTEYAVQKSRFIGHAAPVPGAEGALAFLEGIRKEHRGASHNCFAYIIGPNKGIIRYGDDGEPSGTAGKPIVEVMTAKDVTDCIVVVTRYFGGILLGAGGLARAYAHAAAAAIDAAHVRVMRETGRWRLRIAYPLWDKVNHALQSLPVIVENTEYLEAVKLSMLCRESDEKAVNAELMKSADGKIELRKDAAVFYHPWEE
jgi:uncharacterized YigZ family protein